VELDLYSPIYLYVMVFNYARDESSWRRTWFSTGTNLPLLYQVLWQSFMDTVVKYEFHNGKKFLYHLKKHELLMEDPIAWCWLAIFVWAWWHYTHTHTHRPFCRWLW